MDQVRPGVYDELIDRLLGERLAAARINGLEVTDPSVDQADLARRVGEQIGTWVTDALAGMPRRDRHAAALLLSNEVLSSIGATTGSDRASGGLTDPVSRLVSVEYTDPAGQVRRIERPITPVGDTVLMTNSKDAPSLSAELTAEIASADRIDLVLAFIRWTGIAPMRAALRRHCEAGKPLRVLTTTYTGSTELCALEELADLGAEVRVSYDTTTTRLHAKAWAFDRETGFSTVYIGSSNLTYSAQVAGMEWNVRAAEPRNPELVDAFRRTFETYWEDRSFEPFEAERFTLATERAARDDSILTPFRIEPHPFQSDMLERLQVERAKGHPHNLVVAATGTGKTVVAGLDYRHLRTMLDSDRLLFVAHRKEILAQSQEMFRHILNDGSFGERWVDGERPTEWRHVFASIQSISASDASNLDPEQFDVVIVDEFHHAAAASYEALLDHLRPQHLLGLTATPERTDMGDINRWFGNRPPAVELRLWDALADGLLAPFHYFGVHDSTDLSGVGWTRGRGYDSTELTNVYTADHLWAGKVLEAVRDKVGNPHRMRALAFCVSIEHANFMANYFGEAGLAAASVTSGPDSADRRDALSRLRSGELQVLCAVDIFNEGVDVPGIDTVLMLRPTESSTIFLQQLGRGLRPSPETGKEVLTVLDFVGHQQGEFRFDLRYRRMLGRSRTQLIDDVERGFPFLPTGCHLELDAVSHKIVLDNIKKALPSTWKHRVAELAELAAADPSISLAGFLDESGLELGDVYKAPGGAQGDTKRTWTDLKRAAGLDHTVPAELEGPTSRGLERILHLDDASRLNSFKDVFCEATPPATALLDNDLRRQLHGLLLTMLPKGAAATLDEGLAEICRHDSLRRELLELLSILEIGVAHLHEPLGITGVPLLSHASYSRPEVLAAFGAVDLGQPGSYREGAFWSKQHRCDVFFVTLQKTEKDFSPTTRYLDYAVSEQLFHWESQAGTSVASPTGQRYLTQRGSGTSIALFVRTASKDPEGRTMPFFCAGLADYVTHRSERPIQITLRLRRPLPAGIFSDYSAAIA